ncbi:MAG: amidohydrolase family protein [Ferruginibacter sp.]
MYRKFKADVIFNGYSFINPESVLITTAEGEIVDIVNERDAGNDIQTFKGVLCPGFINCHCHIELSYLKNKIAPHTGLVDFVLEVLNNRKDMSATRVQAMELAIQELQENGTVAIGDICNDASSIPVKLHRTLYWYNFIEVSGFVNETAGKRFFAAEEIAKEFSIAGLSYSIVPHAPYSVSEKLFRILNDNNSGKLISIHNQEERSENELYKNKSGDFLRLYKNMGIDIDGFSATNKTSFQSWLPYFNKTQKIIAVHNTFISQEDIDMAKNVIFCLCINANLYIENTVPPLDLLMRNDCRIVIGTDSYASNRQLNMLEEMKSIQLHFPMIKSETILKWATMNGADALGISNRYGSFEKGKTPGIVLVENCKEYFTQASKAKMIV